MGLYIDTLQKCWKNQYFKKSYKHMCRLKRKYAKEDKTDWIQTLVTLTFNGEFLHSFRKMKKIMIQ